MAEEQGTLIFSGPWNTARQLSNYIEHLQNQLEICEKKCFNSTDRKVTTFWKVGGVEI